MNTTRLRLYENMIFIQHFVHAYKPSDKPLSDPGISIYILYLTANTQRHGDPDPTRIQRAG